MRVLIVSFMASYVSLFAGNNVLSVGYFDQSSTHLEDRQVPNFLKNGEGERIEKGYMFLYERKCLDFASLFSLYAGGTLSKYEKQEEHFYAGSLFFSSRAHLLELFFLRPYVEASLFGPTVFSNSRFFFQNYLSLGAELGGPMALSIELKALRYFRLKNALPENSGIEIPLLLSVGCLF